MVGGDDDPAAALQRLERARGAEPAERPRGRHRRHARARAAGTSRRRERAFRRAAARDPGDWYTQTQLGAVDLRRGRRAAAIAALERARRHEPERARDRARARRRAQRRSRCRRRSRRACAERAVPGPRERHSVDCRPVLGLGTNCPERGPARMTGSALPLAGHRAGAATARSSRRGAREPCRSVCALALALYGSCRCRRVAIAGGVGARRASSPWRSPATTRRWRSASCCSASQAVDPAPSDGVLLPSSWPSRSPPGGSSLRAAPRPIVVDPRGVRRAQRDGARRRSPMSAGRRCSSRSRCTSRCSALWLPGYVDRAGARAAGAARLPGRSRRVVVPRRARAARPSSRATTC